MDQIEELLTRRVSDIIPSKSALEAILRSGKKIKLYQGFDPSSPNLHIGHLVGLLQLKMFQDLGHEVTFLIGDFTGMIGDPTDKSATRPKLSKSQVQENAKTYRDQAGKILRFEGNNAAQMKFNSEWLDQINFAKLIEMSSHFTIQQLLERDMFQQRLKDNKPIFLHEFLYPLMVTDDALEMNVDLEIGGNDQLFNMTVGRSLIKQMTGKDKFAMTLKLITDAEGRKIGKTTGNAINLFGDPNDLFGAIMSQPDSIIIPGFQLATTVDLVEIETIQTQIKVEPMAAKKRLAFEIVKLCHGQDQASASQNYFETTFQQKTLTESIPEMTITPEPIVLIDLLKQSDLGLSNSQIKRVVEEGGVEYNEQKITDPYASITPKTGDKIKFGKHTFRHIICN